MRYLPTALAGLALTISAGTAAWARRELRRQQQAADFRWRHGRNDIATRLDARKRREGEHRLGVNGQHPAGGTR